MKIQMAQSSLDNLEEKQSKRTYILYSKTYCMPTIMKPVRYQKHKQGQTENLEINSQVYSHLCLEKSANAISF